MTPGQERDDWFEGAGPQARRAPDITSDESDDWLQDIPPPPRPWHETVDRRAIIAAAFGLVFLIAVLAAAGVFSGAPAAPVTTIASTSPLTSSTPQPTTTPPAQLARAPIASLKPGDTGAQVKVLQRALASLGYSTGTIDGNYGPSTEAAVKQFQRSTRLTVDGAFGPATRAALAAAIRHRG